LGKPDRGRIQKDSRMIFHPSVKLAMSPYFQRFITDPDYKGCFDNIEISTTSRCSASCDFCFYRNEKHRDCDISAMSLIRFVSSIPTIRAVTWTGGGEPTMHRDFSEITKEIANCKVRQGLITNAILSANYDPSLFDWVRISKTNKEYNLDTIKFIRDNCGRVGLCLNYTGRKDDEQVNEALTIAHNIGLDYVQVRPAVNLKGALVFVTPPDIQDEKLEITAYKFEDNRKRRDYNKCYGFNFVPFIWETGDVGACAYHYGNDTFKIGNINEDTPEEIIAKTPRFFNTIPTCQICCKNHETNKFINYALKIEHKEFM
jgi:GTP 3',8-cyclase